MLQTIPLLTSPKAHLEQYSTPAAVAADLLFTAYDDVYEQQVLDLGCGAGVLAIGAALLGAHSIVGIDIDAAAIRQACRNAKTMEVTVEFFVQDVQQVTLTADTVIMNPPFGAQKGHRGADRWFITTAMACAPVAYSLHLHHTLPFLKTLVAARGGSFSVCKTYEFPLPHQFAFHTQRVATVEVALIRIQAPL